MGVFLRSKNDASDIHSQSWGGLNGHIVKSIGTVHFTERGNQALLTNNDEIFVVVVVSCSFILTTHSICPINPLLNEEIYALH